MKDTGCKVTILEDTIYMYSTDYLTAYSLAFTNTAVKIELTL